MPLTTKIILIVIAILIFSSVGFVVYKSYAISQQQNAINKSMVAMQQLQNDIIRSQSNFASKDDLNAFAKQNDINLSTIEKDLDGLGATITGINQITVNSNGSNETNVISTSSTPNNNKEPAPTVECNGQTINCPTTDPNGYYSNIQSLQLNEPFANTNVPIGSVSFDASNKAPWSYDVYPRTYDVSNVIGTDNEGRHYVESQFSITANGKTNKITINNAKFVEQYPAPTFSWWNPKVFIGVSAGIEFSSLPIGGTFTPTLSVAPFSYGKTKISPDWVFLNVGAGYDVVSKKMNFEIVPAQYNLGGVVPFIKNTYVGPELGVNISGQVSVGAGVRVGL